jgi:hypothetical protein
MRSRFRTVLVAPKSNGMLGCLCGCRDMRSRCLRTVLVALLATLSLGVLASASASASECPSGVKDGDVALCSGGHEQSGLFAFTATKKVATRQNFTVAKTGISFECTASADKGNFEAGGSGLHVANLAIEYSACTIPNPQHCAIAGGKITFEHLKATIETPSGLTLRSEGTQWGTISIESSGGTCLFANPAAKVKGAQKCDLPNSTLEAATHELRCEEAGSELTFGGNPMKQEVTQIMTLAPMKEWSLLPS